ncbi:MAG TPA: 2'-5' RNA ligase family protein, partial [Thermoanaerobaculia bacterium]|nr:2'-5' RNA ligase family protein [Thermoanaerobaculia bacterium]
PELIALRSALNAMAEETIGHPSEEGPFVPHLTVARCRDPWQRPAIATFTSAFSGAIGEPFPVSEAVLVRSHLGEIVSRGDGTEGKGSRHEVLLRMPLGQAPADAEVAEAEEGPSEEDAV